MRYLVDKLAMHRDRVDRVHYYAFCAGTSFNFDSGLTGLEATSEPRVPERLQ